MTACPGSRGTGSTSPCCSVRWPVLRPLPPSSRRSSAPRWCLEPGARCALPLESGFEHGLLALSDGLTVDGEPLDDASLEHRAPGHQQVVLGAGPEGGRLLLLGGEPFDEELLMWWNFVARSHDEVVEAREEWTAAVGGAVTRFGEVTGYDGPSLPAPALPTSRLRPRPSR